LLGAKPGKRSKYGVKRSAVGEIFRGKGKRSWPPGHATIKGGERGGTG